MSPARFKNYPSNSAPPSGWPIPTIAWSPAILLCVLLFATGCPQSETAKNRFVGMDVTEEQFVGTDFYQTISSSKNLVVVDFTAEWCGPCQRLKPILKDLSANGKFDLVMIDTDKNPAVSEAFRVNAIPHLLFIRDGRIVDVHRGGASKSEIESIIKSL